MVILLPSHFPKQEVNKVIRGGGGEIVYKFDCNTVCNFLIHYIQMFILMYIKMQQGTKNSSFSNNGRLQQVFFFAK